MKAAPSQALAHMPVHATVVFQDCAEVSFLLPTTWITIAAQALSFMCPTKLVFGQNSG